MQYKKINNLLGWLCFVIASLSYILTFEPSVSFWDCGEFISCAFKLEVSHQPGYPLFAMICKAFSLLSFGNNAKVAYFTNMGCALASGATVMFLFWTITALAKKQLISKDGIPETNQQILIMGSGLVGALAFAYSDTFWFSAVETIVFAQSSLCIAVVFWAILKWDAQADEPGADKWIVLIAYVMGLSIGIHLLNLLTIPAIALVYFFRRSKAINLRNTLLAFLRGVVILFFVQYGIIQYTVRIAGYFDLYFVNHLGFGFGSGALLFIILLVCILAGGIIYTIKRNKPGLNLAFICITFIYFGYCSFAYIPIRASAGTTLNNTNPDNAFTLVSYLNRDQYTASPLLYGPYFDGKLVEQKEGSIIYRKGVRRYEEAGRKLKNVYDHNTFLPRIFSNEGDDPQFYRQWLQLDDNQVPNWWDNFRFLTSWQVYQMYFRYFLWNFVGRYNQQDGQSSTSDYNGNWTSGLFDGSRHLPQQVVGSNTYTPLFALPMIIGLIGMGYHFKNRNLDATVVMLLWFFMGLGIIIYVNQPSIQPRERDYSYVGSFYAFAIWIGLGVLAFAKIFNNILSARISAVIATAICLLLAPVLMACKEWKGHDRSTKTTAHDMAYDYLVSCPKNAILLTYGDNETYSLWYDQEVENIRPDVRVVNMNLFSADWCIRQMQQKVNESAPLPITMSFDKYKDGIRDVLYFQGSKATDTMEISKMFAFLTSDKQSDKKTYSDGTIDNYLPTKLFKLKVDPEQVVKMGVVAAGQKSRVDTVMRWKFTSNFVTKEKLAMFDILTHDNWDRPICFPVSTSQETMMGLQPYLYREGMTYRLIPFKKDTAVKDQLGKTNTLVMYNNVMAKYKWGNFKHASYLDPESIDTFYPVLTSMFLSVVQNLEKEGQNQLAINALKKYDGVLPDIFPEIEICSRKAALAKAAYKVKEYDLGNKFATGIDNYLVDQLNFQYHALQVNSYDLNPADVRYAITTIRQLKDDTTNANQLPLSNLLKKQLTEYERKFNALLSKTR